MPSPDLSRAASEWLATPLGQYLLAREQAYFDQTVVDIFGYNALQLGLPQVDFLRASRITYKVAADVAAPARLRADFRDLPIAGSSIDLIVLPHVLEFSENPHQVLREAGRVLVPEAQLVISCFNPWSLWGLRRALGGKTRYPWSGRFINLPRLKDWLTLLGLEISGGRMSCYSPPCVTEKGLARCAFMDPAGDRWWPIAGGVYFLQAVKRVRGMRLILPTWAERLAPKEALAPAPKKVARPEEAVVARQSD
jgi:SAM-dependent methyltransferase